jgi:magnesium chelatase subunit D
LAFSIAPADRAEKLGSNKENCSENPASISDEEIAGLTEIALRFGIDSLRAPILAVRCAKAHAQLYGRNRTNEDDIAIAAALVFAHRAVVVPADEDDVSQPEPETREQDDAGGETQQNDQLFDADMIIEAVSAVVPHEVLAGLSKTAGSAKSTGSGAGSKRKGNRRGRPLPSRAGRLDGRNRLDVVATLRAAAPWQTIRRRQTPDRTGLLLRPSDFRVKRFETKSDRLLVFAVDASGSAAVARLNEAKGAIEYLLADAYASRDHVALVVFRGTSAECLLPPTRSLVQAKRRLAAMPGGGGTPLATGLKEGMELALQAEGRGLSPVLVLLTDGRGNVALDGTPNRAQAGEDATIMAKAVLRSGLQTLVVDTSARPQSALRTLAQQLDAPYVPLPRAAADALSGAIQTALPSG